MWIIRVKGKENWELHKLDIWPFSFLLIWNKAENSDVSCCSCFASTSDQISLSFLRKCETLTVKTFNLTIRTWILPPLPLQIPGHSIHLLHKCIVWSFFICHCFSEWLKFVIAREKFQVHSYVGVIALKLNQGYKFKYVLHAIWFSGKLHLLLPWSKLNFPSPLKFEEWVWNVRSSKGHKEIKCA